MVLRGLACLTLCWLLVVKADWVYEPPKPGSAEGEECHKEGDRVWRCRHDRECPGFKSMLENGVRPRTCSWKDARTHLVCCPPETSQEPLTNSISEQKCKEYEALLCKATVDQGPIYRPVFKPAGKQTNLLEENRRKRQASPNLLGTSKELKPRSMEQTNMALIGYGDPVLITWHCGGSLISERFVLSAAHCSNTPYGLARWVRVGDLDITTNAQTQQFEIVERIVHRDYRPPAYYNDVVLFRLDRAAVFDGYVKPACLHRSTEDVTGTGIAIGWDRNHTKGSRGSNGLKTVLKFIPTEACKQDIGSQKEYLPQGLDTRIMICAGEPANNTCRGDTGGPLMLSDQGDQCLHRLVGITTFGPKNCGSQKVAGVYVRVAHFLPWIEAAIWASPEYNIQDLWKKPKDNEQ